MYSACPVSRPLPSAGCGWQTCHLLSVRLSLWNTLRACTAGRIIRMLDMGISCNLESASLQIWRNGQADSLLRADLWKCFEHFKGYGKDALLLTLLAYNVDVGRLLWLWQSPQKPIITKDRGWRQEYLSGVCFILPIQGKGLERTGETETGRVCIVLYSLICYSFTCVLKNNSLCRREYSGIGSFV